MTDVSTSARNEGTNPESLVAAPLVRVIVTQVDGADLQAALATIDRQVYGSIESVVVVGPPLGDGSRVVDTLEEAISATPEEIAYLWLVHADARPRPDALTALVSEIERNDASLGGSKILSAGTRDELESIGSATDVFGEPYSGLDDGEIDLQQYDVVREVAFVSSVSMLVRRDLARGLRGLDPALQPEAAGLDFSQRVRLAGGKVLIVPSSEVYHQGKCGQHSDWLEQAGRLRAMLKAYRPVTLAWMIPFAFIVAIVDSVANLVLLRWRPIARNAASLAWNLAYLPSTVLARYRFRSVRSVGDEELFRFQARGSMRLRDVGAELSDRLLFMFDDDQALMRETRRIWASPGIWGAILAGLIGLLAARSIIFSGLPAAGFSFPFEPPSTALARFFGGWNESGLGSGTAVHPVSGLSGLASTALLGSEGAAKTVMTLLFGVLAVIGMGRLAGRLGFRGSGRYLSGLVLIAGPGTTLAVGAGSWLALGAAAVLPWAIRSVVIPVDETSINWPSRIGWVVLWSLVLGALSPGLVVAPLVFVVAWSLVRGRGASLTLGLASLVGTVVGAAYALGDPGWFLDADRRLDLQVSGLWPLLILVASVPLVRVQGEARRMATIGAAVSMSAIVLNLLPSIGPGLEEAALILASFGAALVVAAALDLKSPTVFKLLAAASALAILVVSVASLMNGRLGLPAGDVNARFGFASTLAGEGGPGRVLVISGDRGEIPGEARAGPGFWYRTLDGSGTTLDEVWLPPPSGGDGALVDTLERIASGAELRPGELLSEFAIQWVVVTDGPSFLTAIFDQQLDLQPVPLVPGSLVLENPVAEALAHDDIEIWTRRGPGFVGEPAPSRVRLAVNFDNGWHPESGQVGWATSVSGENGSATFRAGGLDRALSSMSALLLVLALAGVVVGRVRS